MTRALIENTPLENTSHNRILVTGASGLVGGELIRQLAGSPQELLAIVHSTPLEGVPANCTSITGDILDPVFLFDIMKKVDRVYHCAAIVSYDPGDRDLLYKVNVEGTANVVNACLGAGIRKLVHVSSVAALGRNVGGEPVDEELHWDEETGRSVYGKSKYYGEMEVWRGISEGLQAVIVNPSIILGGTQWTSGSSSLFKTVYDDFGWYSEGIAGFTDVRDVARAMILLMNSEISGQRFILNSENLSYKDVFFRIARHFDKKPPSRRVTPLLAETVWRWEAVKKIFTGKKPLVTRETARTAQAAVRFENRKVLQALPGFAFTPVEETIGRTCQAIKEKYHL